MLVLYDCTVCTLSHDQGVLLPTPHCRKETRKTSVAPITILLIIILAIGSQLYRSNDSKSRGITATSDKCLHPGKTSQ